MQEDENKSAMNASKPRRFIKPSGFGKLRPLLFAITAIALLYAIRELEYAGLRKSSRGEFAKLREAFLEPHPCDILILGSSRAECQFYPPVIDSATKLHTFNIGMTGATMSFVRTSLEAYLENSPAPKYILLNLDLHSLTDNPDTVHHFPRYFAYLSNEKLRAGLQKSDSRFTAFRWCAPYSMGYFNARYLNASLRGWLDQPGKYDSTYYEGFTPCENSPYLGNYDTLHLPVINTGFPEFFWTELAAIRKICTEKKIELILVISPVHEAQEKHVLNYAQIESGIIRYSVNEQVKLMNLGKNPVRYQQKYYADPAHLNREGAILFSRIFSDSLAQYIRP